MAGIQNKPRYSSAGRELTMRRAMLHKVDDTAGVFSTIMWSTPDFLRRACSFNSVRAMMALI